MKTKSLKHTFAEECAHETINPDDRTREIHSIFTGPQHMTFDQNNIWIRGGYAN